MIDNDGTRPWTCALLEALKAPGYWANHRLGSRCPLWPQPLQIFPTHGDPDFPSLEFPFQNEFLRGYEIFINDGTRENSFEGVPILQTVAVETQNDQSVVDVRNPPQYVRFVRLKVLTAWPVSTCRVPDFWHGFCARSELCVQHFRLWRLGPVRQLALDQDAEGDANLSGLQIRTRTVWMRTRSNSTRSARASASSPGGGPKPAIGRVLRRPMWRCRGSGLMTSTMLN